MPILKPIDAFPCRYAILVIRPKSMGGDTDHVSYGTPEHPGPDRLLSRGFGCLFKTQEEAQAALRESMAKETERAYLKGVRFQIVPMYQTWDDASGEVFAPQDGPVTAGVAN